MGSVPICTRKKTFSDHWLITYNCNTKIVDIRNTDHRWWSEKDDFALWEVHTKKNKKYILNEQNNLLSKKLFSVVCQFVLWPRQLVRQFLMLVLLLVWKIMYYANSSHQNNPYRWPFLNKLAQFGSKYPTPEIQIHLNTGQFSIQILNGCLLSITWLIVLSDHPKFGQKVWISDTL